MAGKSRRGFASMDASRQREIASKGGRAAHAKGTAHEWTSDEARVAGQKGGVTVSRDRAHMAAIGREGGESRSRASRAARDTDGGDMSEREMSRPVSRELGGSMNGVDQGATSNADTSSSSTASNSTRDEETRSSSDRI